MWQSCLAPNQQVARLHGKLTLQKHKATTRIAQIISFQPIFHNVQSVKETIWMTVWLQLVLTSQSSRQGEREDVFYRLIKYRSTCAHSVFLLPCRLPLGWTHLVWHFRTFTTPLEISHITINVYVSVTKGTKEPYSTLPFTDVNLFLTLQKI